MKLNMTFCLVFLILMSFAGCNPNEQGEEPGIPESPVPLLFSISPTSRVTHLPPSTLSAFGDNFVQGAVIVFNGREIETTYIDDGQLTCELDDTVLTADSAMSAGTVVTVSVRNPGAGDRSSSPLNFTIYENHTFTPAVPCGLGSGSYSYYRPYLAVDKPGSIHVVFHYYDAYDQSEPAGVGYTHSSDGGETWIEPVSLAKGNALLFYPSLAVSADGTVYVVFIANSRVNLVSSGDGGFTWSDPVVLSGEAKSFASPKIEVDAGGGLNVVWACTYKRRYFAVYFTRSEDGGVTWTEPGNLFNNWDDSSYAHAVELASDSNGGVFVTWTAWSEYGKNYNGSVFANYSHNRGVSWNYTDTSFGPSWFSDISVDPSGTGSVYVAAGKIFSGYDSRLVLLESRDRGISWSREEMVPTEWGGERPRMVMDPAGNINLVYLSYPGPHLYFTRSVDKGATWSEPRLLFQYSAETEIAADHQGNLYIVSEDVENTRLYFRRSVY